MKGHHITEAQLTQIIHHYRNGVPIKLIAREFNVHPGSVSRLRHRAGIARRGKVPTPSLDEPISKVTLNLYSRDIEDLRRWEMNWSAVVRDLVKSYCATRRRQHLEKHV